ncbi:APC family permease [Nostoc sp. C117]|uniref:APC family permease n=1 Tax=Nostoc sp. C117 TaxID=3349875 RepID=UPI00370DCC8C
MEYVKRNQAKPSNLTIGRWQASTLAVSFVVGASILVLPTLAFEIAGPIGSIWAWISMTAMTIPLILIFIDLGIRDFQLGGIGDYCKASLGQWSELGVHLTLLSALLFGIPAIVWITAGFLQKVIGIGNEWLPILAHSILIVLSLNNMRPIRRSTHIAFLSFFVLVSIVFLVIILNLGALEVGLKEFLDTIFQNNPWKSFNNGDASVIWEKSLKASVLVFFGYVGWESLTLCLKDLEDREKNIPFVYWASFGSVAILYFALALTVSGAALSGLNLSGEEGILKLISWNPLRLTLSLVMLVVLLANVNAWLLGGSRQLHQFFCSGLVPGSAWSRSLATLDRGGVPRHAVFLYSVLGTLLLLGLDLGWISVSGLILFVNQNWIVLYGGVLLHYFRRAKSIREYVIAFAATMSFLILVSVFSWWLLVTLTYFLVSAGVSKFRIV